MYRSIPFYIFVLTVFIGNLPLWGQMPTVMPQTDSTAVTLKPIDVRFATVGGLSYRVGDEELNSYQDFQDLMGPLKDYETERLLKRSITTDDLSRVLKVIGVIGLVGGIVGVGSSNVPDNQVPFAISALTGAVVFDVGLLFGEESQTTKFNAVQRYNRFAYGREQVLPQAPADEKSLLPAAGPSTAATPSVTETPSATAAPDIQGQTNGS